MASQFHYDRQARNTVSLRARAQGPAAQLKRFHNHIKRRLLESFAEGGVVLDIGCGRGGDIAKWAACGAKRVVALDVSADSIAEAGARLRRSGIPVDVRFVHGDFLRCEEDAVGPPHSFDVAACMFALHYFWKSAKSARAFFAKLDDCLRPGGVFLGVVPDGDKILELCGSLPYASPDGAFRLTPTERGYIMCIADTVVDGDTTPEEYFLFEEHLAGIAAEHGFEPVHPECPDTRPSAGGVFHHLVPPFSGGFSQASSVYAAFAFRKRL